ncbi:hypothetical protein [Fodinibius sp.]|uniref:hypothetical protein n=1 Tax=Fodinibius sp. TaxID=1872440 RepID=UPI003561FBCA
MHHAKKINILTIIHGLYFGFTGIWPLVHMRSFLFVTGPKTDLWLVETVGILVLVIGLGLVAAGLRKQVSFPLSIIAIGSSVGLMIIDVVYVWSGVIPPVYLSDALLEVVLITAWIIYIYQNRLWETRYT